MINRRPLPRSLYAKMLIAILISLAAAALIFFLVRQTGNYLVQSVYLSEERSDARRDAVFAEFRGFVKNRSISSYDTDAISEWSAEHEYATILVFKDQKLNMRIRSGTAEYRPVPAQDETERSYASYGRLYTVKFVDCLCNIAVEENSYLREYFLVTLLAAIVSAVLFAVLLLLYFGQIIDRIMRLSREAAEIGSGDINSPISIAGEDEIADLARSVDGMRSSVIERMRNESRAWQANSDLITAISHDIRTPMTSMIGYLTLLRESDTAQPEKVRQFTDSAYSKAMELKALTDELFKYFLVFGKAKLELQAESFEAPLLLGQMISEAQFDLVDAGFAVYVPEQVPPCLVSVDALYLKRVFDNLVSNVKKYAEPSEPVHIECSYSGTHVSVMMKNTVRRELARVESTKIGIQTCQRIMDAMSGSFETCTDGESFTAVFSLPAEKAEN